MAAVLPAAPAVTVPHNYAEYYAQLPDVSQGDYTRLFAAHHPTNGKPSAELFETVLSSSHRTPKVFLARARMEDGNQHIIAIHRPSTFEQDLLDHSNVWQERTIAFVGDIQGNGSNFIKTVLFPAKAFDITDEQLVPTLADMTPQFTASATDTDGPFVVTDANTEALRTRLLIPVPHPYIRLVLGKSFTPRVLWEQLGTTIINDGHQADCSLLLNWIWIAAPRRHNNPVDAHSRPPANHMF